MGGRGSVRCWRRRLRLGRFCGELMFSGKVVEVGGDADVDVGRCLWLPLLWTCCISGGRGIRARRELRKRFLTRAFDTGAGSGVEYAWTDNRDLLGWGVEAHAFLATFTNDTQFVHHKFGVGFTKSPLCTIISQSSNVDLSENIFLGYLFQYNPFSYIPSLLNSRESGITKEGNPASLQDYKAMSRHRNLGNISAQHESFDQKPQFCLESGRREREVR